jgi:hypothetical protein
MLDRKAMCEHHPGNCRNTRIPPGIQNQGLFVTISKTSAIMETRLKEDAHMCVAWAMKTGVARGQINLGEIPILRHS